MRLRGRGQGLGAPQTVAKEPANPRLWAMLVRQAKARFHPYPSIPAQKWIHEEYVRRGGRFVRSKKEDDRHDKHGNIRHDKYSRMADKMDAAEKKATGKDKKDKKGK